MEMLLLAIAGWLILLVVGTKLLKVDDEECEFWNQMLRRIER